MDAPSNLLPSDTWCRDCGAMWTAGSRICHCAACHQTFTGEDAFTDHQRWSGLDDGHPQLSCVDPASHGRIDADASGRCRSPFVGAAALHEYRRTKPKMLNTAEGVIKLTQLMNSGK